MGKGAAVRRAVYVVIVGLFAAGGLVVGPARPGLAAPQPCPTTQFDANWTPPELPWSLRRLQPKRAWPITRGEGVLVAVIDTGIDVSNPHLRGQVEGGESFLNDPPGSPTEDCVGHGTGVAGVIAAKELSDVPLYGVAPAANVLSLRQSSRDSGTTTGMAEAIRYAVDNGADVINISVTSPANDPNLEGAVQYATDRDVVIVAAAGNDNLQTQEPDCTICYPAAYEPVLAVAAVEPKDVEAELSHEGSYVDVAAPGVDIVTTAPTRPSAYQVQQGTSFAAPYVAGVAALVRARYPDMPAQQVVQRIKLTADPPVQGEENVHTGVGVVNPYAAVARVMPMGSVPPQPSEQAVVPEAPGPPDHMARNVVIASVGTGALTVAVVAALAVALPRGRRRRWQPGRWQSPAEEG